MFHVRKQVDKPIHEEPSTLQSITGESDFTYVITDFTLLPSEDFLELLDTHMRLQYKSTLLAGDIESWEWPGDEARPGEYMYMYVHVHV